MNRLFSFSSLLAVGGLLIGLVVGGCTIDRVDPDLPKLTEVLEQDGRFSIYLAATKHAGRYEDMDGDLLYTLFIPTNQAWDAYLNRNNYANISEVPDTTLSRIIWYQRQYGKVFRSDFFTGYVTTPAPNYSGYPIAIRFDLEGQNVGINKVANLTEMDEEYLDGVIHISDYVLEPPDLIDALELNGNFETLLEAIELAGMTEELRTMSDVTFFAPHDEAFEGFFATEVGVNDLEDYTQNELIKILRYHVLEGVHPATELRNLSFPEVYSTLLNNQSAFISSTSGFVFVNDSINISLLDVHSLNATIHIVDDVLEFE